MSIPPLTPPVCCGKAMAEAPSASFWVCPTCRATVSQRDAFAAAQAARVVVVRDGVLHWEAP